MGARTKIAAILWLVFWAPSSRGQETRRVTAADMPRIPHTEPQDALATFRVADGFDIELVAAEPMVSDPVAACFDEFGRMFVAEMHGYPFSHEPTRLNPKGGGLKDGGVIRMLEDVDGDGVMDKSVVFADGLNWPTSVCCYNGGVFVIAPEHLLYLKDTDGDNKADVRDVVLAGFGRGNVQAVTNGLLWGLNNHIYFAAGRNPNDLKLRGEPLMRVGSSDLRFDPKTETFEVVGGGQQFGHSRDDWGTRFVCSNSDHIRQVVYPPGALERNPYLVVPATVRSIASDGASARVFRTSPPEPWRIVRQKWRAAEKGYRLVINGDGGWEFLPMDASKKAGVIPTEYPVGFFTSATGITIYRGDAYPDRFSGNAFIGDVGGNLVHQKRIDTTHVLNQAYRATEGVEFLTSTDNWFRPVNFVNAPDGTLYVLDMYRETIEHPYSIPEEIKAFLDLTSGRDRGRIYRFVSREKKPQPVVRLGDLNNEQLVLQLASTNGWNRDTAQRLLWERQDQSVVPLLEQLLTSTDVPHGRLHVLWTLQGLGALKQDHILTGVKDGHPRVRAHAIRLADRFLTESSDLVNTLATLSRDNSEHVRFHLAFTLGQSTDREAVATLTEMAANPDNSAETRVAILSSADELGGHVAIRLLKSLATLPHTSQAAAAQSMLYDLGLIVGANRDPQQAIRVLEEVTIGDYSSSVRSSVLLAIGNGLSRRGATYDDLMKSEPRSKELPAAMLSAFRSAAETARDDSAAFLHRTGAIELLAFADYEQATAILPDFLSSRWPSQIQQAAVQSLGQQSADDVATILLNNWKGYSPSVRREVISSLLSKSTRILMLLDAVEAGAVKRSDIDRDHKQLMTKHRNTIIKQRSSALFGSTVTTNRSQVVADYQSALQEEGDAVRGQVFFKKICAQCHRVGDMGHQVAPDLASVKNKSEADLLIAILDPNREAQPNFNTYTVVTKQGRSYTGIITAESTNSVTLKRAEAKEDTILRSNIEEIAASGVSLMPEGLEKELSPHQVADVIAFIKSISK